MSTLKAGQIAKGMFLLEKEAPYLVAEREFVNPGKGSAFVRLKLKNLRNGSVLAITHKTQDTVEEIDVTDDPAQFLYSDGENYVFMHTETFEQFEVPVAGHEDASYFMKEGDTYPVIRWETETLDIRFPPKMVFVVAEAEEAIKGDTVTGATKYIKTETGLTVKVPIFIKQGEKIRISTETKEYIERVND